MVVNRKFEKEIEVNGTMTTKPERNKQYEWFLKETNQVKGPGGMRLKCVWASPDVDYEVVEYPLINPDGSAGPRLLEFVQRINGKAVVKAGVPVVVSDHLKLGMHIFAEVQRHFAETKTDTPIWEFAYETISSKPLVAVQEIPATARKKILFQVQSSSTLDQLRDRVRAIDPSLLTWLEQMLKTGEVKFP